MLFKYTQQLLSKTGQYCKYVGKRNLFLSSSLCQGINPGSKTYKPNNMEKRFLVWTGKYKTVAEVPAFISNEEMERTRNKIRIRVANLMMVATVVGCILMVISGKRAKDRGESVTKQNLDWHQKYNEENPKKKSE